MVNTGFNTWYFTSISFMASRAISSVSATTRATASPTKRTYSSIR